VVRGALLVERESWRVAWRDREAQILSDVAACAREAIERECVCARAYVRGRMGVVC